MLMIGNPTPDLEVETFMPDGRFERMRFVQAFQAGGAHRLRVAAGRWLAGRGLKRGEQP